MNFHQTTNLNSTSSRSDPSSSPLLLQNDFQIYTKKKVKKILKCLGEQEKIKLKIKKLLETEEDTELYKKILLSSLEGKNELKENPEISKISEKSVIKQKFGSSPHKENINPNMLIEYSYSPNLLIKNVIKIKNTPSPQLEVKCESQSSSESQGICSILNKVFNQKSGEKKNKENSYEDAFSDRNLNSHYLIKKEDDPVKNFLDYEKEFYVVNAGNNRLNNFENFAKFGNNSNINLGRNLRSNSRRKSNLPEKPGKFINPSRSVTCTVENFFSEDEKIFTIEKNYFKDTEIKLDVNSSNLSNLNNTDIKQPKSTKDSKEIIALKEIKQKYLNNSLLSSLNKIDESFLSSSRGASYSLNSSFKSTSSRFSRQGMRYKMFSKSQKKFCLDLVKDGKDPKEVSDMCEVPLKSLKRWLEVGYERKKGCGRKVKDPELERKVLEWYNQRISMGKTPTPKEFVKKALKTTTNRDFLASKGWLEKFRKKHNLILNSRGSYVVKKEIKEI
jgi:hypothetical protein